MEYQTLTGTGAVVSRLSLGTMTFGQQVDESTAVRIVDQALEAGINFVDTADAYSSGRCEEILGRALKGRRHRVVLASKVCNLVGEDRHKDAGLHRWHVIHGVEASLRRLQTDCLDLCYLHCPDGRTPIEETMAAFDALVRQGKVLYVGMSNFASWQVCEALWRCDVRHWSRPVAIQVPYNLIARSLEEECVAFARQHRVAVAVYDPLAGGLLSGKYRVRREPEPGTRFAINPTYHQRYWSDANLQAAAALAEIAAAAGTDLLGLSLRWLLTQAHVDSVILGVSKPQQLAEDLGAVAGRLPQEALDACDAVWAGLRGSHFRYNR